MLTSEWKPGYVLHWDRGLAFVFYRKKAKDTVKNDKRFNSNSRDLLVRRADSVSLTSKKGKLIKLESRQGFLSSQENKNIKLRNLKTFRQKMLTKNKGDHLKKIAKKRSNLA